MTKSLKVEQYVASVATATGHTKKDTREIIKEFLTQWGDNTAKGIPSQFSGVGKTVIRDVEASTKRNPATGEQVQVDAHQKPKFVFSGKVKNVLRGNKE